MKDDPAYIPVEYNAVDPLARRSLRDMVVERILNEVFERRFTSGSRLVVHTLADWLQVSPTPVREALVELAGLGIIELQANRGAVVNPFGPEELKHISQVRQVLEMEACRSACGKLDRFRLQLLQFELKSLNRKSTVRDNKWDREARETDSRLHLMIADGCGNPRLAHEIRRYLSLFWSLRNISHLRDAWENYRRSNDVPQHLKIVQALLANDADAAAKAVDKHIRAITVVLSELMFTAPSQEGVRLVDRRSRRTSF